jgi:hypothetical protein
MLSAWSKDDITQHKNLDDLLSKKASWTVTTAELVQVYRALVWVASLKDKIEKSQVEDVKVTQLTPPLAEEEPKKPRAKKSQAQGEPK